MAVGNSQPDAGGAGTDWFNQFVETPQQEYERFVRDYHSTDRPAVLAAKRQAAGLPPETGAGTSGGASGGAWTAERFTSLFGRPGTPQELIALESQLSAQGIRVLRNAAGVAGKVQLPDGRIIDIINAAGAGGRGFQWLDDGGSMGVGELGTGDLARPYGRVWTGNEVQLPQIQPWGQTFTNPSLEEIRATPGYQFTRDEGIQALDRRAAAMGTVLNGGQNLDIARYVTGLADETGQRAFDNKLSGYRTNFDIFRSENSDRFSRALQTKNSSLEDYLTAYNVVRNDRNDIFGRFDRLASRGVQAADALTS